MSLQDITITSSIKSIATQSYGQRTYIASTDEQSFPIEAITGSYAGVWPNLIPGTNYTVDLVVNVTQSWSGSNTTISGSVPYIHDTIDEFYNGEFSGSEYVVSDGNLTDDYCQQFLHPSYISAEYKIYTYSSSLEPAFLNSNTAPRNGELLLYYDEVNSGPPSNINTKTVKFIKIAKIDNNGVDFSNTLGSLVSITLVDPLLNNPEFYIATISEQASYFYYSIIPITWINQTASNTNRLNYSFEATSSVTSISASNLGNYSYFNNSSDWSITTDSANGYGPFLGSYGYTFPLTPNVGISFTSSMSLTTSLPITFSWALQGWDLANTQIVETFPTIFWNPSNYQYLSAGTHNLVISSSTYHPIQDYQYQINTYAKSNNLPTINQYLTEYIDPTYTGQANKLPFSSYNIYTPVFFPSTGSSAFSKTFLTYQLKNNSNQVNTSANKEALTWQCFQAWGANRFYWVTVPLHDPRDNRWGFSWYGSHLRESASISQFPRLDNKPGGIFMFGADLAKETCNVYTQYGGPLFSSSIPYTGHPYTVDEGMLGGYNNAGTASALLWQTPPFSVGSTYSIAITIPSQSNWAYDPSQSSYDNPNNARIQPLQNWLFGPSNTVLTCSTNRNDLAGGTIGYIPSGAYGTFIFTHTCSNSSYQDLIIANPDSASLYDGTYYTIPAISEIYIFRSHSITVNKLTWEMTQSISPPINVGSSSLIYEPYLPGNFYNTDCDVLINNYSQNDVSRFYREVLYDDGGAIPSNLQQIISGTAQYAEINDYLYSANANRLPRYEGVRTTSPNFNLPSLNGLSNEELSGLSPTSGIFGNVGSANVNSYQTYMAYYDYITSSYAELSNKSLIHVQYLIDKDGNVSVPSLSSSYYYNLIDNFESNKFINIALESLDDNVQSTNSTIGLKKVLRPGVVPWGIVASTISGSSESNKIYFTNQVGVPALLDYSAQARLGSPYQQIATGAEINPQISQSIYTNAGSNLKFMTNAAGPPTGLVSDAQNGFKILQTSPGVKLNLNVKGNMGLSLQANGVSYTSYNVDVRLYKYDYSLSSWSLFATKTIKPVYGQGLGFSVDFPGIDTSDLNAKYRVNYYNPSGYYSCEISNVSYTISQQPVSNTSNIISIAGTPTGSYWITGSTSKNILTGSATSSATTWYKLYTGQTCYQDLNQLGSSLGVSSVPFKPFQSLYIQPGDQIRFSGDENQTYNIREVILDDSNLLLCLKLDKDIVDGTNLNSFLIRRYVEHPNFITMDWDTTGYVNGSGFLFPAYMSIELQNNFDKIVTNLREQGLI